MANNFKRSIAMLLVLNMLTGMIPVQALADEGAPSIEISTSSSESSSSSSSESSSSSSSESSSSSSSESSSSSSSESSSSSSESSSSSSSESSSSSSSESSSSDSSESSSSSSSSDSSSSALARSSGGSDDSGSFEVSSSETNTESFDGGKPDVSYDSELTYGDNIGGIVTETTEKGTNSDGDDVVKETTTVETNGKTDGGETVTGSETYVETTTTTDEVTRVETEQSGEEKTEGTYEVDNKTDVPEVEAPIILGGEAAEEEVKPGTESVTDENGVTTETTTTVDKVENEEDGTTTETVTKTEEVMDADGNVIETTDTVIEKVENEDGTTTTTKTEEVKDENGTTTETTTTTEGNGVTTETTVKTEEVTDENGETVTNTSTSTSTTTTEKTTNEEKGTTTETVTKNEVETEADGIVTETDTTVKTTTDENGVIQNVVTDVIVKETTTEITGDQPEGEDDKIFDFTKTEVTIVRDVTVEAEFSDAVDSSNTDDLVAVAPDGEVAGKGYDDAEGLLTGMGEKAFNQATYESIAADILENQGQAAYEAYLKQITQQEGGYDYQWTGYGDATNAVRAVYVDVVYKKNPETGEPMKDEDGNYIIESYKYNGKYNDGMGSTPAIFALTKQGEKGDEYFYGYCIDAETEAVPGTMYKISNLEDSEYYPDEESANKLRAIASNGYWGKAEGEGSAEAMIDKALAYYQALHDAGESTEVSFQKDDLKNPDSTMTVDALKILRSLRNEDGTWTQEAMTELDADVMTVTQAAIWSYANGTPDINDGQDRTIIEAIYSVVKPNPKLMNTDRDLDTARDARLAVLYQWIMNLEGVPQDDESVSTVINEKNAFEDIGMTIKEQVADHANNQDNEKDNDVYETEVNFTLAFVPDPNSDALLVQLTYGKGEEKKTIVKRLAGENAEGEDYETIAADENGTYTISGLQLEENSDFTFDLNLTGTHLLKEGVYVYSAYGGASASQTMVGMASGTQNVNVKSSMTISFDVDDSKHVVATRKWSTAGDPEDTPRDPGDNPPPPALYRITRGVGQLEIIDEEVPLAEPPQTGDISMLWFAMIVMSACGLCMLNLFERKREQA